MNSNLNSRTSMHHFVFVFSSLTFILNNWLFEVNVPLFLWVSQVNTELKWSKRSLMKKNKVYSAAKRRLNGRMYLHLFSHTSDDCPKGTNRYGSRGTNSRPYSRTCDLLNNTVRNRRCNHHYFKTNRKLPNEPQETQIKTKSTNIKKY